MCDGPDGSLLVMNRSWKLCKLDWDKTQDGAQLVLVQLIPKRTGKALLKLCYVEYHDILMCNMVDDKETKDYEIITMKLGSETIIWRLFGPVEGHVFKPIAITCDPEGNAYVHDPGNIRILKINSLTGEILSILLLEVKERILSMRWSYREPNLTVLQENQISTYFVPK